MEVKKIRKFEDRFLDEAMNNICKSYCRYPYVYSLSREELECQCFSCYIRNVFFYLVSYPPSGYCKNELEVFNHE